MTAAQRAKEAIVEEVVSFATLTVSSTPPDAAIYVDTAERGKTPATISMDMGISGEKTVDMALTREGYLTKRGQVLLQAGGTANWDATLERDSAYVTELVNRNGKIFCEKDGAEMVLIPKGTFLMGSPDGEGGDGERSQHEVSLNTFYIDKYEVTNAQFKKFIDANPQWRKDQVPSN